MNLHASWRGILFGTIALMILGVSNQLELSSDSFPAERQVDLANQIPLRFGSWRVDESFIPIQPSPDVQAKLHKLYDQVLARTYVDANGSRIMLSIAYGAHQGSEATAVHRPEFCYVSQGFAVSGGQDVQLPVAATLIPVRHLVATMGSRMEPITYWVTLDKDVVRPGIERKLKQIALGLRGHVPDGMLVRVSSIEKDPPLAYDQQRRFLSELFQALDPELRERYFGRQSSSTPHSPSSQSE